MSPNGLNRKPLKKIITATFLAGTLITSCTKMELKQVPVTTKTECESQTANPSGKSYDADSVVNYNCTTSHCGIIPLSSKNYWIYQDSIFENGVFSKTQLDTLNFAIQKKSLGDGLVWWQSSIEIGLPELLYANDSSFFALSSRIFDNKIKDVRKEFGVFSGDSIRYQTSFEDVAAIGKSLKLKAAISTMAGTFSECLYFEKNARNYRKDQIIVKPGVGVIRYVQEMVPPGERYLKLQKISTLVKFHFE